MIYRFIKRGHAVQLYHGSHFSMFVLLEIKLGDSGCKTVNSTLNSCEDQYALCDKNLKCVCKPEYYDDNRADTRLGTCRQSKLYITLLECLCADPRFV